MNTLEEAYAELFPGKQIPFCTVEYSGRLKAYNARISLRGNYLTITASKTWRGVSPQIQKGLFQELLVRVFKVKKQTIYMDLYHHFMRSLPRIAIHKKTHPVLEQSFQRVNDALFLGLGEQPNLKVGRGINRLGTYEYASDTVTISSILLEHPVLMDYVMYHELLHRKHQYTASKGRSCHHSHEFLAEERKFPNAAVLEEELQRLVTHRKSFVRKDSYF